VINVIAVARTPCVNLVDEDVCKGHRPLVVSECNECSECDEYNGSKGYDLRMPHSVGSVSDVDPPPTVAGIREMGDDKSAKLMKYHKPRLIEAIVTCMARIDLLETSDDGNVRSELRRLKASVFAKASASTSNAVVLQDTQDILDRLNVGWDAINKLAEEQNPTPLTASLTPPATVMVLAAAPPNGEDVIRESDKSKLAKRVKLARSKDLWCLSPFTPVTQEAMDKPRKVCPVHLRVEVCMASNCGSKHPKVCLVADHSKGKIPEATCLLWHMRVPFAGNAGNVTGRRNGFNHPPGSKGSKAKVVRPAKPDAKLAKLTATALAEELKARIRTAKMMLQGILYSQVVQAHAPVNVAPAPTSAPAPAPAQAPAPTPPNPAAHHPDCSHSVRSDQDTAGNC
jgi:hypothetical protein